jgi:hypothetical protein
MDTDQDRAMRRLRQEFAEAQAQYERALPVRALRLAIRGLTRIFNGLSAAVRWVTWQ